MPLLLILLLPSLASCSPLPRDLPSPPSHSALCAITRYPLAYRAQVSQYGALLPPPDPRGCGRGLLDHLRGQCGGWISYWTCQREEGYEFASFAYPLTARRWCVEDALWLATEGQGGDRRRGVEVRCY
ncbi:MAG: hypothetical protein M1832_002903 [Thelocarpon impressellum]|nr:MAG: hypothetical protein M1832_002903 [Thelocarpon impressellum]